MDEFFKFGFFWPFCQATLRVEGSVLFLFVYYYFFISGASFEAQNGRRILKQPKLPVVITFNDDQVHNNKIVHAKIYISPTCTLQW